MSFYLIKNAEKKLIIIQVLEKKHPVSAIAVQSGVITQNIDPYRVKNNRLATPDANANSSPKSLKQEQVASRGSNQINPDISETGKYNPVTQLSVKYLILDPATIDSWFHLVTDNNAARLSADMLDKLIPGCTLDLHGLTKNKLRPVLNILNGLKHYTDEESYQYIIEHDYRSTMDKYLLRVLDWRPELFLGLSLGPVGFVDLLIFTPFLIMGAPLILGLAIISYLCMVYHDMTVRSLLRELTPEVIMDTWLRGAVMDKHYQESAYQIAKELDLFQMLTATLPQLNAISDNHPVKDGAKKISVYLAARQEVVESNTSQSLALTIILGIAFLPSLLITIAWYQRIKEESHEELQLIGDVRKSGLRDASDIYLLAEMLREKKKTQYAVSFFGSVRADDKHYKTAMSACSMHYIAEGNPQLAMDYVQAAGDGVLEELIDNRLLRAG